MVLKRGFGRAVAVWTRGNTTDQRFFVATPGMASAAIKAVLVAIFVYNATQAITIQVAYQESDDGETWPDQATFTLIPNFSVTADGPTYDDAWNSVTLTKKYVRFGFAVVNTSGSGRELANCALRLDTRATA
jgi:hypothetical protein